jgi:hypothetical protein
MKTNECIIYFTLIKTIIDTLREVSVENDRDIKWQTQRIVPKDATKGENVSFEVRRKLSVNVVEELL